MGFAPIGKRAVFESMCGVGGTIVSRTSWVRSFDHTWFLVSATMSSTVEESAVNSMSSTY